MAEEDAAENEEQQEGEEQQAPAKGGKKKLLLIAGAVLLLLLLVGAPAAYFMLAGGEEAKGELDKNLVSMVQEFPEGYDDEDEWDEDEEPLGAIFPMEKFVVNLAGVQNYMRVQVQIEFTESDVPSRFYARQVLIRDAIINILTSRSAEEVTSPEGRTTLKDDIQRAVNQVMRREMVKAVYFTQYVVQ